MYRRPSESEPHSRPWAILGAGGITQFRSLRTALEYNYAVPGTQLLCWDEGKQCEDQGMGEYAKFLSDREAESLSLGARREQVAAGLRLVG